MKSILDSTFRYIPSNETDIRKTFARVRKEIARKAKESTVLTFQDHAYVGLERAARPQGSRR